MLWCVHYGERGDVTAGVHGRMAMVVGCVVHGDDAEYFTAVEYIGVQGEGSEQSKCREATNERKEERLRRRWAL